MAFLWPISSFSGFDWKKLGDVCGSGSSYSLFISPWEKAAACMGPHYSMLAKLGCFICLFFFNEEGARYCLPIVLYVCLFSILVYVYTWYTIYRQKEPALHIKVFAMKVWENVSRFNSWKAQLKHIWIFWGKPFQIFWFQFWIIGRLHLHRLVILKVNDFL